MKTLKKHVGKHQKSLKNAPTWLPEWLQETPGGSLGPLLEKTLLVDTFLHGFWVPVGLLFGSLLAPMVAQFLINFLNTLLERSRPAMEPILERFGLHFGVFLVSLWGSALEA